MKPKIIAITKQDRDRAKILNEIIKHYWTDKEWEQSIKELMLREIERQHNPLGEVEWWLDKK